MYNDQYDSPDSGDEIYEKTPMEQAQEAGDVIKPFIGPIIGIIVILLIAFFAYDFFVGSVKNVTFDVKDTEGEDIIANISISSNGEPLPKVKSGRTIELKTGKYNLTVTAIGYNRKNISIVVESDSSDQSFPIIMQIENDLEIKGEFPITFFTGEKREIQLTIINNDSDSTEVELVLDGDAKSTMTMEYDHPILAFNGETQVIATIKVKERVDEKYTNETNKGGIRIRGLSKEKIESDFEITQFTQRDVSVKIGSSTKRVDFRTMDLGETSEKELKIENRSESEITNISIEVYITTTQFSDKEEVEEWFSFSPSNIIDTILIDETKIVAITLTIPATVSFPEGKSEETIGGIIKVNSNIRGLDKTFDIDLKIKKPKTGILITGINDKYTMRKSKGSYSPKVDYIEIKNTGSVLLTDFEVRIKCIPDSYSWLSIENNSSQTTFETLARGQTKQIPFTIIIPNTTSTGKRANCGVEVTYIDPAAQKIKEDKPVQIITA